MTQQTPKFDPLAFSRQLAALGERAQKLTAELLARRPSAAPFDSMQRHMLEQAGATYQTIVEGWKQDPKRLLQSGTDFMQQYLTLWQGATNRIMGQAAEPVKTANAKTDKRFASDAWQQNAVFDFIKESYLLASGFMQKTAVDTPGLDAKAKAKVEFYTRQWTDALSPANFWMTNPEALRQMAETNGDSLMNGFQNLLNDFQKGDGQLRISMTNPHSYVMGENIAATPGKVIFRNHLLELIHYAPTTETVAATPFLVIPPWINKYYILDLREQNSFVKHALDAGQTVFLISWVNPDASHAEIDFQDYLGDGALAALKVVEEICATQKTNIVGYCLGGTLLACLLAYLQKHEQQNRVASATYLTALTDFSEPGDLGVFIDDQQITAIEAQMFQQGYLEAAAMATTFNLLRSNDLIWSFVINNYLLGREPLPFDLLYWNADATNLPALMHSTYLRQMYLNNKLCQPNGLTMLQTPLDLSQITTPTFAMAARDDHIAPWHSVYRSAHLNAGPVEFVLAGSGHIAGVVNPPGAKKYQHWIHSAREDSAEDWLANATEFPGSWWGYWYQWLEKFSGGNVAAREVGVNANYLALEDAPGSYVKVRAM